MFCLKTLSAALLLAAGITAIPTAVVRDAPSNTTPHRITHSVVAGLGGLRFDPDNVVAEVGDIIEWHFLPKNHSIAESSFGSPCVPLADGSSFFSGFEFVTDNGQAKNVFQIEVKDKKPIWYYCAQGNHCSQGMTGVINQNFNNQDFSLRAHRALAVGVDTVIPGYVQGGSVITNPNPNGGF